MEGSEETIHRDHVKKFLKNYMTSKRSSVEFKKLENKANSKRISSKRMSKEYRKKENVKNAERLKQKRTSSVEYKQHEKEVNKSHMSKKRLDSDYRKQENTRRQQNEVTKQYRNNLFSINRQILESSIRRTNLYM